MLSKNDAEQIKTTLVSGANANTNITLTGIATNDALIGVYALPTLESGLGMFAGAGAAQGANMTCTGITASDTVLYVVNLTDGALVSFGTATVGTDVVSFSAGGNLSEKKLLVVWAKAVAGAVADLTAEASIPAANTIKCSTTVTTGRKLLVVWRDKSAG